MTTQKKSISLGTLYKVSAKQNQNVREQIGYSIWVNSGSVDIYASDSETQPTAIADMTLNTSDTAVAGKKVFDDLSEYIAVIQNTGTTTELILNNINVQSLGAIS